MDEFYGYAYILKCPICNNLYPVFLYIKQNVIYFYKTDDSLICKQCKQELQILCCGKIVESGFR